MEESKTTANILRESKAEILNRWEEEVRKTIRAADLETSVSLRDSIPFFLDDLITALDTNLAEVHPEMLHFAHKHGSERANLSYFSIEDAINEYNVLRKVIFEVIEKKHLIGKRPRDIIYDAISLGLAKAGAEYAKAQIKNIHVLNDELTHSNENLNLALEISHTGIFRYHLLKHEVELSPREAEIFGYDPSLASISYHKLINNVYPDDRDKVERALEKAVKDKTLFVEEYRIIREDGKIRWLNGIGKATYSEKGDATLIIGTNVDITDAKEARDVISNLARRLQVITDIQPTLIAYINSELRYRFANETFGKWFLVDQKEVLGKHMKDMIGEKLFDKVIPELMVALNGETISFEHDVDYPIGKKYVHISYIPHKNSEGKVEGIFISIADLTDQKMTIDRLQEEQILREKFISTLTHDLRTPLTAAKMSAQLISRKNQDSSVHTLTSRIVDNISRADRMIQDLLDASKIRAGKHIAPSIQEIDLIDVTKKTLEDLTTIHGERFKLISPPHLKAYLCPSSMRRLLENLCSNAIKYGSQYDPINVSIEPQKENINLSVENTGNPLININQDKLFEPFVRGSAKDISGKKGWGIGLTIVKGVAESHGGNVEVNTDSNHTQFMVHLPVDARNFAQID